MLYVYVCGCFQTSNAYMCLMCQYNFQHYYAATKSTIASIFTIRQRWLCFHFFSHVCCYFYASLLSLLLFIFFSVFILCAYSGGNCYSLSRQISSAQIYIKEIHLTFPLHEIRSSHQIN